MRAYRFRVNLVEYPRFIVRRVIRALSIYMSVVICVGCQSLTGDLEPSEIAGPQADLTHPELADDTTQAAPEEPEQTPSDSTDIELTAEDFDSGGFCHDDIVGTYLQKHYETVDPLSQKLKRYRSRYSRNRVRRSHKTEALHYAKDRFVGKAVPYYGTIPVVINEKVEHWLSYFKGRGRRDFMRWLMRGEAMRKILEPTLKEHGMPKEFYYLAMVESGFNNRAYSRAAATGTWQFMKGTARLYGMKVGYWIDERRDPVKSTVAAANYLKDLYSQLGDWYLAMAAYNAGPGKVRRAIRRLKTRDFWKIAETRYLARETKHYVPKMLAALLLANNAEEHGFKFDYDPANDFPTSVVYTDRPVKLSEVAKHLGVSTKELQRWNPELIRGITPPKVERYPIRLSDQYIHQFAAIRDKLSYLEIHDVEMYKVRRGDTLSQIARRYKVRVRQILSMNPRLRPRALRIGKVIAIPVPGVVVQKKG